jgi:three-Cys-motif partner protein
MPVPKTTVWPLEPHTKAKHEILRRYLGAWFPILASGGWNRRVIFLDGFAGPGRYSAGEPGSPIIALNTLVSHPHFTKLHRTEFVMIFVEDGADRFASLQTEVAGFWEEQPGGQPSNVKVHLRQGRFADVANEIMDQLDASGHQLAPTFAFVDPFGIKGVPMTTIARLVKNPKCEVFFNFMFNSVNRWITHPEEYIQVHLEDLYGCDAYQQAAALDGAERKALLHDLYAKQLHDVAGREYVHSFEMVGMSGKTTYSLFFGTQHIAGLKVMKDAMWSIDPATGVCFSDRLAGQDVLFQPEPDFGPLRAGILQTFAGRTVSVETIEHYVLVATPYKASHYKKQVLKLLQDEGLVHAESGQTRRGTYPAGTVLRFEPSQP